MKEHLQWSLAVLGAGIGWALGDFDGLLYALLAFVVIDYISGLLAAAFSQEVSSVIGFVKHNGVYKPITAMYCKQDGIYKE